MSKIYLVHSFVHGSMYFFNEYYLYILISVISFYRVPHSTTSGNSITQVSSLAGHSDSTSTSSLRRTWPRHELYSSPWTQFRVAHVRSRVIQNVPQDLPCHWLVSIWIRAIKAQEARRFSNQFSLAKWIKPSTVCLQRRNKKPYYTIWGLDLTVP